MINNIYYKCTVYYAFYEASTNPWSLKHAFQLKFHLSQNNKRIITLQQQQQQQIFFNNTLFSADGVTRGFFIIYLFISFHFILFLIWLELFSL